MLSVNSKKLENNTLLRHRMVVLILYLPISNKKRKHFLMYSFFAILSPNHIKI